MSQSHFICVDQYGLGLMVASSCLFVCQTTKMHMLSYMFLYAQQHCPYKNVKNSSFSTLYFQQ
jgi:hypothetical protein